MWFLHAYVCVFEADIILHQVSDAYKLLNVTCAPKATAATIKYTVCGVEVPS